ncbi:hypothetical protein AMECASPLE_033793, partial [Ameca splendens]
YGAVGALALAPVVLGAIGFTSAGIVAGSYAASMMSAAAITNGGGVAAGSLVEVYNLQVLLVCQQLLLRFWPALEAPLELVLDAQWDVCQAFSEKKGEKEGGGHGNGYLWHRHYGSNYVAKKIIVTNYFCCLSIGELMLHISSSGY